MIAAIILRRLHQVASGTALGVAVALARVHASWLSIGTWCFVSIVLADAACTWAATTEIRRSNEREGTRE